jgi:hypothetical protein
MHVTCGHEEAKVWQLPDTSQVRWWFWGFFMTRILQVDVPLCCGTHAFGALGGNNIGNDILAICLVAYPRHIRVYRVLF